LVQVLIFAALAPQSLQLEPLAIDLRLIVAYSVVLPDVLIFLPLDLIADDSAGA
jgi:hypothetical protein